MHAKNTIWENEKKTKSKKEKEKQQKCQWGLDIIQKDKIKLALAETQFFKKVWTKETYKYILKYFDKKEISILMPWQLNATKQL